MSNYTEQANCACCRFDLMGIVYDLELAVAIDVFDKTHVVG